MTDSIRQKLDAIVRLTSDNRIDDAESMCREGLITQRDEINLLGMLGAILIKKGDWDEAEKQLRRAIEVEPAFAKPHEDLGALYLARNDQEGAVLFYEKALALDPGLPGANRGLAIARHRVEQKKNTDEPSIATLLAEADLLRKNGVREEAEQICDVILSREPENIDALRILAIAATEDERFVIAEGYLRRITKLVPGNINALRDLGKFLGDRGRYPEAIQQLQPAAALSPQDPDIQLYLANMFGIVGRIEDALQAYEICLEYRKDDPAALIGRGHMLRIGG